MESGEKKFSKNFQLVTWQLFSMFRIAILWNTRDQSLICIGFSTKRQTDFNCSFFLFIHIFDNSFIHLCIYLFYFDTLVLRMGEKR